MEEVPIPTLREGESLVRVDAAAVSHLDLTIASGSFDLRPDLPYIPGVEGCGVVEASNELPPGTRVLLRGAGLGMVKPGTWAEYVAVKSKALTEVPANLLPELAATFFQPATTAQVTLEEVGRLGDWPGVDGAQSEVVVVAGAAGAVGSIVAQLALRAGSRVVGLAEESQRDLVPAGVEFCAHGDEAAMREMDTERPATVLIDTVGGDAMPRRMRWVRPGGRAVAVGYVAGTTLRLDLPSWLLADVALLPVNMMRRESAARSRGLGLADLFLSGDLTLNTETFGLEELGRALESLASGRIRGRGVVLPARGSGEPARPRQD
ncbi:quinone oxidoreductase family protein [Luedemannella helvata]|uniref:quinone oxidoreductase family protein n=1 Tax=Luedemannella helvata TaxID=349315 RepID=UPI0031E07492